MSLSFPVGLDAVLAALVGAGILVVLRGGRPVRWVAALVPLACLALLARPAIMGQVGPDAAALPLAALAAFVAFTAALVAPAEPRPAALQAALLGGVLLGLLADNIFLAWLGALGAGAALALLVPGRANLVLLLLLLLALLGLALLTLAARPVLGPGLAPLAWSALLPAAAKCNPALLGLAFAFLLVGYGGIGGLAPLQFWMRGSAGAAPAVPFTAVGLLTILRLQGLLAANPAAPAPGPPLIALGLVSLALAAFAIWRRADDARFLGWIGVLPAGLAAVAIGSGAGLAAVLLIGLRMLVLTACQHALGARRARPLACAAALVSAAALPPSGLFGGVLLILAALLARAPLLALPVGLALAIGAAGILAALPALWPTAKARGDRATTIIVWVHLGLAALLGLALPATLAGWLQGLGMHAG